MSENRTGSQAMQQPLTPQQEAQAHGLVAELMQQLERVGVDMPAASSRLREIAPSVERQISADEYEVSIDTLSCSVSVVAHANGVRATRKRRP